MLKPLILPEQALGFSDLCFRYGIMNLIDDCEYWDL